jgi:Zn-dependent protease with chaperone function
MVVIHTKRLCLTTNDIIVVRKHYHGVWKGRSLGLYHQELNRKSHDGLCVQMKAVDPSREVTKGPASTTNNISNGRSREMSSATARGRRVQTFPAIQGSDFQHPLDKQNTNILRSLPGLQFIAKSMIMSAGAEEVLFLENISSSIRAGPSQLPTLYGLLTEACSILGMDQVPDLYIRQNPSPNAYTLALSGKRPFIVLHTSLLDLLDDGELQAVIAHELGHLKCDHAVWLTAANVLALGTVSLLPLFTATVEDQVMRWLRSAELSCDRAALLVTQDPKVVVRSFMKLAGGSSRMASELNVDAFLEQARSYEQATASPMGWYLRNAQNRALSHPLPVLRAREIDAWSHSDEYRRLLLQKSA